MASFLQLISDVASEPRCTYSILYFIADEDALADGAQVSCGNKDACEGVEIQQQNKQS